MSLLCVSGATGKAGVGAGCYLGVMLQSKTSLSKVFQMHLTVA